MAKLYSGLGVTNWMVCLCKLCLSDIIVCLVAIVTYFNSLVTYWYFKYIIILFIVPCITSLSKTSGGGVGVGDFSHCCPFWQFVLVNYRQAHAGVCQSNA